LESADECKQVELFDFRSYHGRPPHTACKLE